MKERIELRVRNRTPADPEPYGCCLAPAELAVRTAKWRQLAGAGLVQVSQKGGKLVLRYRRDRELEAVLRHLVAEETKCCSSLRFEIAAVQESLKLEISGPWQATPWAGALAGEPEPLRASGDVREFVRQRYAAIAQTVGAGVQAAPRSLPGAGKAGCGVTYDPQDLEALGDLAGGVSLGCGNAIGEADPKEGETVLDLGSGAGWDALIAAKRVGSAGKVFGLDMTDEMLAVAKGNQTRAAADNVQFLKGYIEEIPLPAASVDVVISNCVINLSASKPNVFREMFRVTKPGGRIAVSDVVAERELDAAERSDMDAWGSCLAGALTREEYRRGLEAAGFENVRIVDSHEVQPGFSSVLLFGQKA